jgi:plasmid stabilization system protein ParE
LTLPVVLLWAARSEFDDAFDWYESQQAGVGSRFVALVHETFDRIADAPKRYPRVLGNIRRAKVPRFPYLIFYQVEPGQIAVLSVFHSSRDPRVWQGRV